jgi:hypothetical protein
MSIGRAAKNGACSLPLPTGFTGLQIQKMRQVIVCIMIKWLIEYNDLDLSSY